jgi:hypothetical protein
VYAVALSALIFTYAVGYAVLDLFLARPYVLGTHTEAWMGWHGMGCLFVGLCNLLALQWTNARAQRDVAAITALIFGVWCLQNLRLVMGSAFRPLMWMHVIGCGIACVWSVVSARALQRQVRAA